MVEVVEEAAAGGGEGHARAPEPCAGRRPMSRRARQPGGHGGELAHDLVEPARELGVAHGLGGGPLPDERDRPARLEDGAVHLVERLEALLVRRRLELGERDQLGLQAIEADLPVLDEDVRLALDQTLEPLVAVEEADHERVRREQGRGAEQPAGDRVVVADDGVLHGVREREQHDQVEGIELRQLPLAGEPEADHQEGVDDDGPQHLLRDRHAEVEHVAPQLRLHVSLLPAAESSHRPAEPQSSAPAPHLAFARGIGKARAVVAAAARISLPSPVLFALEGRAWLEFAALVPALPLLARAPRGDGHPVLVLPGWLASDRSTWALRRFLRDRRYHAPGRRLGRNLRPDADTLTALGRRFRLLRARHGRKLSLIGWSLGGIYARELARRFPADVPQVLTLA